MFSHPQAFFVDKLDYEPDRDAKGTKKDLRLRIGTVPCNATSTLPISTCIRLQKPFKNLRTWKSFDELKRDGLRTKGLNLKTDVEIED